MCRMLTITKSSVFLQSARSGKEGCLPQEAPKGNGRSPQARSMDRACLTRQPAADLASNSDGFPSSAEEASPVKATHAIPLAYTNTSPLSNDWSDLRQAGFNIQ